MADDRSPDVMVPASLRRPTSHDQASARPRRDRAASDRHRQDAQRGPFEVPGQRRRWLTVLILQCCGSAPPSATMTRSPPASTTSRSSPRPTRWSQGQDRAPAPHPDPLPAALLPRDRRASASNSRSDWFFAFLERFPTPASITALSKEAFIAAAWDVVGRKVVEGTAAGRYLRDGAELHRLAGSARCARRLRCSAWCLPRRAA